MTDDYITEKQLFDMSLEEMNAVANATPKKAKLTPEGRKRMSDNMYLYWRYKNKEKSTGEGAQDKP